MSEHKLREMNNHVKEEILITERPEILQRIVEGVGNTLAPYGGVSHGGEKLFFVGLVLGYAKPDPVTGSIEKFATTSFCANYTNINASILYDSAARQAAISEDEIARQAKSNKRQDSAEVHDPLKQGN